MDLKQYFAKADGLGILSTADENGVVNSAVYSKPHVIDDEHVAFIMGDRRTHANLKINPSAVFLFKETGPGFRGKRVYLKKAHEFDDKGLVSRTCKRVYSGPYCEPRYLKNSYLVSFTVASVRPLVGDK